MTRALKLRDLKSILFIVTLDFIDKVRLIDVLSL